MARGNVAARRKKTPTQDDPIHQRWWEELRPRLTQHLKAEYTKHKAAQRYAESPKGRAEHREFFRQLMPADEVPPSELPHLRLCTAEQFYSRFHVLRELGGRIDGIEVSFGDAEYEHRDTLLRFVPQLDAKSGRLAAQFIVPRISDDYIRAELNRAGCGLWDETKNAPGVEYSAICDLYELQAQWNSPDARINTHGLANAYLVINKLADAMKKRQRFSLALEKYERIQAHCASGEDGFFASPIESEPVRKIKDGIWRFSAIKERPPSHDELFTLLHWPKHDKRGFRTHINAAGCAWLPRHNTLKRVLK